MGVGVVVRLVPEHEVVFLEMADDGWIGVEDLLAGPRRNLSGITAVLVHRHDRRDPGGVGSDLVVLTEAGRQVNDPGALLGGDVVGGEHLEGVGRAVNLGIGEAVEQRPVPAPGKIAAADGRDGRRLTELGCVVIETGRGENQPPAVVVDDCVLDVGTDGNSQIGRKRPRCCRPRQQHLAGRLAGVVD